MTVTAAAAVATALTWTLTATSSAAAASSPKCSAADLGVWVAADQTGAAAGTLYMPIEFTNLSHQTCTLYGFPGVSALSVSGQQLGSPATWDTAVKPSLVRLAPGGTGYALLEYSDVITGNCPAASKRLAFELRVYPPDQSGADHAYWPFTACVAKGQTHFIRVRVIAPGIGVRGSTGLPGVGSFVGRVRGPRTLATTGGRDRPGSQSAPRSRWSRARPSRMKSSVNVNSASSSHRPSAPPWVTARAISTT